MKEKYVYIEPEKARELLFQTKALKATKHGIDSQVYLIDEYAVLTTSRLRLRNVATRDDDLAYFDELIGTLMRLREQGVSVVPILGYCYDPNSKDGNGYIFQPRAKGEELYDDDVMKCFYVWAQSKFKQRISFKRIQAKEHLLSRTNFISRIPQNHFDKFISDIVVLSDCDVLIDFNGKSNFFYDAAAGFQFIDLDSHTDYKYGLAEQRTESAVFACTGGFAPCHFAVGTTAFSRIALDEKALSRMDATELQLLARGNRTIYEKCKTAMLHNGIPEELLNDSLKMLKIFGC